jgi:hypothetical protein
MKQRAFPYCLIAFGLLLLMTTGAHCICAAQSTIHGKVVNSKNEAAVNATVMLLHSKDSSLIKAMVSDNNGAYVFNNVDNGSYLIASNFLGYKQAYSNIFTTDRSHNDMAVENIMLAEETVQLKDVSVTTKKPLLEQKIDRLIINVASSITSAGNTALEVLERSPGVIVDRQNNTIAINGKDGVVVMINGKINHMPASGVIQWLNGMGANNIEKIELITTPPANLDAEGNAGYINVVLKQNNNYGTNGSFTGTLGYGKGWVSQAGMNINHRKGKVNMYGDISYSRTKGPLTADIYNKISNAGVITETNFHGDRTDTIRNITGRFGLDWQTGAKTIAGILVSGYDNRYTQAEHNTSSILINGNLDTTIYHNNNEINHWSNYSANLNLQHDFNENNKLLLNADYIHYYNNQPVNYHSLYYDKDGEFVYDQLFRSGKTTPMDFWVGAADYSKKINKNIDLETGIKQTFSSFDNNISFERLIQNAWIKDDSLSANYKMKEDYSAAYFSFDITINSNTAAKAGLRYEHTNSNLGTEDVKNIVDRHYGNFFPAISISLKLNEKSTIDFSYSKRITRPTFNDLAPFTYYVNENTLITGNPSLQPSLINKLQADYTVKQYLFSLSYSKENNAFARFQPHTDSVNNKIVLTAENLINQKTASALMVIPFNLTKWWSTQLSVTGVWQQTNALYKGEQVSLEQAHVSINANMRFTLPHNFSAEITGKYQSEQLFGIYRQAPTGTLDVGLRKKLPGKWGSLILNATNILNTEIIKWSVDLPEQNLVNAFTIRNTLPTLKLTYSRNFGNNDLKGKRERSTGAEDENGRVHN